MSELPYDEKTRAEFAQAFTITGMASRKNETPAWVQEPTLFKTGIACGQMVSVRPVAKQYEDKTFLGVYIGEIAQHISAGVHTESKTLVPSFAGHNPAIFVPDLNTVIFGNASWWGEIKDEKHLREITDDDIENVWYVRALRQLAEKKGGSA